MFYSNYTDLCRKIGKSPNAVANDLKIASSTVTEWKRGRVPQNATLLKVCNYFNVTPEYLLGETDNREKAEEKTPSKILEDDPMREKEKQMWELWHRVPDEQKPQMLKLIEAALAIQLDEYKNKNGGQKE